MPDAPELVEGLLTHESDLSCQRAAFYMLSQTEPGRALNYFNLIADRLPELDGSLQLAVIAFIRQDARHDPENEERLIKILLSLMKKSSSAAARFESATTLMTFPIDEEVLKGNTGRVTAILIVLTFLYCFIDYYIDHIDYIDFLYFSKIHLKFSLL